MNKVSIHLAAQWRAVYPFAGSLSQTEEYINLLLKIVDEDPKELDRNSGDGQRQD